MLPNKEISGPLDSSSLKPGIQSLYERVFWKDGARCHPVRGPIRGYSFSEIIAGYGGDGLYYHVKFRLGTVRDRKSKFVLKVTKIQKVFSFSSY